MPARLTSAALIVVCLLAAGCGGNGDRKAVSKYIEQVNAVETKLSRPMVDVSKANRDFATGKGDPAQVRLRLAKSERTIRTLERRLAALHPPKDARKLHGLLLELVRHEEGLAREVAQLAAFVPAFSSTLAPVGPAGRALKAELNSKQPVAGKAAALEAYGATLGDVLVRLRTVEPPPSSRPVYASQVMTLQRVRKAVTDLALALREKRTKDVAPLLHAFDVAAVANQSVAAQKAQIAAVRAYNARIRKLDTLTIRIARERNRLQRVTG